MAITAIVTITAIVAITDIVAITAIVGMTATRTGDEEGGPAGVPVQGILQGTFAAELQNHPRLRHLALCSISTLQLLLCMPLHAPQAAH